MKFLDYDEMKQLKVGDVFAEEEYDWQEIFVVQTAPVESKDVSGRLKLEWTAKKYYSLESVNFLVTKDLEHYGPNVRRYDVSILKTQEELKMNL